MKVEPINRLRNNDIGMKIYATSQGIINESISITIQSAATQTNAKHMEKKLFPKAINGPANSDF